MNALPVPEDSAEMEREKAIRVFSFQDRDVRVIDVDGEPWWVAKDVCDVLDIGNITDALGRLEEDEFDSIEVTDSMGRQQQTKIINESGLFSLILGSCKPEAKAFKRWVTQEILASIKEMKPMGNELQVFDFENRRVRVVMKDGEPCFVAKDVVEGVGAVWEGAKSIRHIPEEWKGVYSVYTPGGMQEMQCLTEPGVYFYLARSDKPAALPFQKKIAGEVLPTIRKRGFYASPNAGEAYDELMSLRRELNEKNAVIASFQPRIELLELAMFGKNKALPEKIRVRCSELTGEENPRYINRLAAVAKMKELRERENCYAITEETKRIASESGVSTATLYRWVSEADRDKYTDKPQPRPMIRVRIGEAETMVSTRSFCAEALEWALSQVADGTPVSHAYEAVIEKSKETGWRIGSSGSLYRVFHVIREKRPALQ